MRQDNRPHIEVRTLVFRLSGSEKTGKLHEQRNVVGDNHIPRIELRALFDSDISADFHCCKSGKTLHPGVATKSRAQKSCRAHYSQYKNKENTM